MQFILLQLFLASLLSCTLVETFDKEIVHLVDHALHQKHLSPFEIAAANGFVKSALSHPKQAMQFAGSVEAGFGRVVWKSMCLHFQNLLNRIRAGLARLLGLHGLAPPSAPSTASLTFIQKTMLQFHLGMVKVAAKVFKAFAPAVNAIKKGADTVLSTKPGQVITESLVGEESAIILTDPGLSKKVGERIGEKIANEDLERWARATHTLHEALLDFIKEIKGLFKMHPSPRLEALHARGVKVAAASARSSNSGNAHPVSLKDQADHHNFRKRTLSAYASLTGALEKEDLETLLEECMDSFEAFANLRI